MVTAFICKGNNQAIDIFFDNENILVRFLKTRLSLQKVEDEESLVHYRNCNQIDVPDAFYEQVVEMFNTQENLSRSMNRFRNVYSGVIADL
jgi:hypothetical protein